MSFTMRTAAFALLAAASAAQAQTTVSLNGHLGNQQALLVIDGEPVAVAVGSSARGVRLLSLAGGQAEVMVDGARRILVLGATPVRTGSAGAGGNSAGSSSISLTANGQGHFITEGKINGQAVSFMVDTGASTIALSQGDADRIGLTYKNGKRGIARTANGDVPFHAVTLNSVRVGDVEVANVEASVLPGNMPHVLLGNSFLTRFQMKRENDVLKLDRR